MIQAEAKQQADKVKGLHKLFILNQTSEETYVEEKVKLEALEKRVQEKQVELGLINQYQFEDTEETIKRMEELNKEFSVENGGRLKELQNMVVNAKYEYMKTLAEAGKEYRDLVGPRNKLEELKNKLFKTNKFYFTLVFPKKIHKMK